MQPSLHRYKLSSTMMTQVLVCAVLLIIEVSSEVPLIEEVTPSTSLLEGTCLIFSSNNVFEGGSEHVIRGSGFYQNIEIFIEGTPINKNFSTWLNSQLLAFIAPSLFPATSGYKQLLLRNPDGSNVTYEDFYYSVGCAAEGYFWHVSSSECRECPSGAVCPGGDRIWPLDGYWNSGENSGFIYECEPQSRCIGGRKPSCIEGTTGFFCGTCSPNYFTLGQTCRECNSFGFYTLVTVFMFFLLVYTSALFMLEERKLSHVMWGMLFIQVIIAVAKMVSSEIPYWMAEFYGVLSIFAFDLEFLRLGCTFDGTWVYVYFGNLLLFVTMSIYMVLGHYVYGYRTNQLEVYAKRLARSLLILFCTMYFIITTRSYQGVFCVSVEDVEGSFLQPLMSQRCYIDWHVGTLVFSYPLLIFFTFGLPIGLFLLLKKYDGMLDDVMFSRPLGFLYETFKSPAFIMAPMMLFLLNILSIAYVFLERYRIPQFIVSEISILVVLGAITKMMPFYLKWEYILSSLALIIACFGAMTNFLGAEENNINEVTLVTFSVIMIVAVMCLLCAWAYLLWKYSWDYNLEPSLVPQPAYTFKGKQIERPTASATVPTVGQQEITSMGYDLDKTTNASRPSTARMSRPSTARSQQQQQQQEYRHHHQLQGSRPSSVMSTFPDAPRTHSSQSQRRPRSAPTPQLESEFSNSPPDSPRSDTPVRSTRRSRKPLESSRRRQSMPSSDSELPEIEEPPKSRSRGRQGSPYRKTRNVLTSSVRTMPELYEPESDEAPPISQTVPHRKKKNTRKSYSEDELEFEEYSASRRSMTRRERAPSPTPSVSSTGSIGEGLGIGSSYYSRQSRSRRGADPEDTYEFTSI